MKIYKTIIHQENPHLKIYTKSSINNLRIAQIWNVEMGENGIEDKIAALYELEYKLGMVQNKPFNGLPERRENILNGLRESLGPILEDVKSTLLRVFGRWLEFHALLSAETWAQKRVEDIFDGLGEEDAYYSMVGEYMQYAIYGGEKSYPSDKSAPYRFFREIISKAMKNLQNMPVLNKVMNDFMYDYRNQLMDELSSEGLEGFSQMHGKKFRNQEQAENYIMNLKAKDVDSESLMYFESVKDFIGVMGGREEAVLIELYKKFVFPYWVKYWKDQGIADTRKNIAHIYKQLQSINSGNMGNALAVISIALNSAHQTGEMLDYISEEGGGSGSASEMKAFLNEMSAGNQSEKWNQELREVGVQI